MFFIRGMKKLAGTVREACGLSVICEGWGTNRVLSIAEARHCLVVRSQLVLLCSFFVVVLVFDLSTGL